MTDPNVRKPGLQSFKLDRVGNGWLLEAEFLGPDQTEFTGGNSPTPMCLREIYSHWPNVCDRLAVLIQLPAGQAPGGPTEENSDAWTRRTRKDGGDADAG